VISPVSTRAISVNEALSSNVTSLVGNKLVMKMRPTSLPTITPRATGMFG
jgi:hypothetical protein